MWVIVSGGVSISWNRWNHVISLTIGVLTAHWISLCELWCQSGYHLLQCTTENNPNLSHSCFFSAMVFTFIESICAGQADFLWIRWVFWTLWNSQPQKAVGTVWEAGRETAGSPGMRHTRNSGLRPAGDPFHFVSPLNWWLRPSSIQIIQIALVRSTIHDISLPFAKEPLFRVSDSLSLLSLLFPLRRPSRPLLLLPNHLFMIPYDSAQPHTE